LSDPSGAETAAEIGTMTGAAALPRVNGEPVFEAPWQGRVFGVTMMAVRELGLDWDEFRQRLIAALAEDPDRPYYDSWVDALESFLVQNGLADAGEIAARAAQSSAHRRDSGP
jgi:nitrile hydratase accessory protein